MEVVKFPPVCSEVGKPESVSRTSGEQGVPRDSGTELLSQLIADALAEFDCERPIESTRASEGRLKVASSPSVEFPRSWIRRVS